MPSRLDRGQYWTPTYTLLGIARFAPGGPTNYSHYVSDVGASDLRKHDLVADACIPFKRGRVPGITSPQVSDLKQFYAATITGEGDSQESQYEEYVVKEVRDRYSKNVMGYLVIPKCL